MSIYTAPLQAGKVYHVYNQGNNGRDIFKYSEHYHYFLKKYHEMITPFFRTYAYCLLPNHFHFVLQVKTYSELHSNSTNNYFPKPKAALITVEDIWTLEDSQFDKLISDKLSRRFANLFSTCSRAFNKANGQKDKLFAKPFKRLSVEDEFYFENLIGYVHRNPIHHGFTSDYEQWKYSSYFEILEFWDNDDYDGMIDISFLKDWFETKNRFIEVLEHFKAIYQESNLYLE